jgi:hypothetical protein
MWLPGKERNVETLGGMKKADGFFGRRGNVLGILGVLDAGGKALLSKNESNQKKWDCEPDSKKAHV